ncbi:MAG: 4-(cytidine 5'-diphospho)-2-C-methyl-D-erythritol kinase [Candidatus Tumulicola sp.]
MAALYRAPAKINLTLEVLARRADGLHGIRSVMVPLELSDELIVESSERFTFVCDRTELEGDENLAVRALGALGTLPAYRVELRKHVPVQAGLGGGSSDAAAVLGAAMRGAFGTPPPADWPQVARALGSDVPFFLAGTGALVEGTGERVTPLGAMPRWHVVVVKPPVGVSTADAYALVDRTERPMRSRALSVSLAAATALQRGDFQAVQSLLHNDFQSAIAAESPPVATALDALAAAGAVHPLLAGSGSCVFALAQDAQAAAEIAQRLSLPTEYARWTTAFAQSPEWRA